VKIYKPPPKKETAAKNPKFLAAGELSISFDQTLPYPNNDFSSTQPAPLNAPDAPRAADFGGAIPLNARTSYLWRLGKAYLAFYKTGLKNIYSNYKEYTEVRRRIGKTPIHEAVLYSGTPGYPTITRRDFQLYLRTVHDLKTLVPFGLIFAICGEFTPFVIPLLGSRIVPFTCRIPRQVTQDHLAYLARCNHPAVLAHNNSITNATAAAKRALKRVSEREDKETALARDQDEEIKSQRLLAYCMGAIPTPRRPPILADAYHRFFVLRRLNRARTLAYCDQLLLHREGGLRRTDAYEILKYAESTGHNFVAKFYRKHRTADAKGLEFDDKAVLDEVLPTAELVMAAVLGHDTDVQGGSGEVSWRKAFVET
jgi:hypothetical protein